MQRYGSGLLMRSTSRLKTTAQLLGLFPPDPELSRPTQELFEQFWKAHGYPNEAEKDLLEQVGYVDAAIVDAWCKFEQMYQRLHANLATKSY